MEKLAKKNIGDYSPNRRYDNDYKRLSWPKDWLIKLISLFFAIFLWYFVAGEDRVDMNVRIPVEIVNLPRDLVISNQFKDILDVTVSGPRSIIREISRQHISRSIDLSHATPGNIVIDNKNDSMSFPRGITVLRVQPSHIILLLDKLIQKDLPIRYLTMGRPAAEYELDGIDLEPKQLTISGPQTLIDKEADIPTKAIDLTGLSNAVTRQVFLKIPPELADLVGEPSITAHIKIKQKIVEREIGKIPIIVNGLSGNRQARLETKIVKVKVRIPLIMVNKHDNLKKLFKAEINAEAASGRQELKVKVTSKPGIFIEEIAPPTVGVTIK
jgi:YbbR domain-containing protein